jgi:hypothetical protein
MKQLVCSWVEAEKSGYRNTLGGAIEELNKECGTKLTYSRLAEWRKGKYTPSQKVLSQLLYRVLPWALLKVGIKATEAQLDALEDLIWNVRMVDGQRHIGCCRCPSCM